jgi:hypothetical protein
MIFKIVILDGLNCAALLQVSSPMSVTVDPNGVAQDANFAEDQPADAVVDSASRTIIGTLVIVLFAVLLL